MPTVATVDSSPSAAHVPGFTAVASVVFARFASRADVVTNACYGVRRRATDSVGATRARHAAGAVFGAFRDFDVRQACVRRGAEHQQSDCQRTLPKLLLADTQR